MTAIETMNPAILCDFVNLQPTRQPHRLACRLAVRYHTCVTDPCHLSTAQATETAPHMWIKTAASVKHTRTHSEQGVSTPRSRVDPEGRRNSTNGTIPWQEQSTVAMLPVPCSEASHAVSVGKPNMTLISNSNSAGSGQ